MDVDVVQPTRNSPFISFFDVSSNFPWQEPRPEQIRFRRALMLDSLVFDVLLMSGGISEPYLVYPPEDPQSLKILLDTIESSHYDTLKKDCLVYFLLKWHQDGRERNFQQQRCIPPQFAALADAYWHLDTGINVPRAVAILSDSRLNRDYASKIIHAISISPDSEPLIRRYIQTAKPLLIEPLDIECYALALAHSSVLEAWQFSRTFNDTDPMRARLFKKIIEWTVTPNPRPVALTQLLALPLSTLEESVFNSFVQKPPPSLKFSAVVILQDLICVRLIQGGRYSEAIKLDRQFTSTTLPKNLNATKDRSKMVHDVYTALPSVERSLIDLELDPTLIQKVPLVPKPVSPTRRPPPPPQEPEDISLSQSWEDVRISDLVANNKSTPLREVRVPSATPRFGAPALQGSTSTPKTAPILPINFNGVASGSSSTPRKSLPLSASVLGSTKPRSSLSGVGSRMAFGTSPAIASPASAMKVPLSPTKRILPASSRKNKRNERAFQEDTNRSPERAKGYEQIVDVDMETEREGDSFAKGKERRHSRKNGTTEDGEEEDNVLQYSVFGTTKKRSSPQTSSKKGGQKKAPQKAPKTRNRKNAHPSKEPSKPPAKKPRQVKEKAVIRRIPGGLMDEDEQDHEEEEEEEEDHVAPLRAPSPPRRGVRKARSSVSVEGTDDSEGVQTRRRSSRLSTHGSAHGGSPEPQPATKTRKGVRTAGTRKKR
ncbi:nuclear pore complex assembly-domain-containing protein [Flammula alnicola]|nr:nuclear pore complex assembly-domain-containing protein [Flammula alnicola]